MLRIKILELFNQSEAVEKKKFAQFFCEFYHKNEFDKLILLTTLG